MINSFSLFEPFELIFWSPFASIVLFIKCILGCHLCFPLLARDSSYIFLFLIMGSLYTWLGVFSYGHTLLEELLTSSDLLEELLNMYRLFLMILYGYRFQVILSFILSFILFFFFFWVKQKLFPSDSAPFHMVWFCYLSTTLVNQGKN